MKSYLVTLSAMILGTSFLFAQENPEGPGGPRKHKHPKPEQVFAKLDADANGSVTLEEFKESPKAQKNPVKAEEIFSKIDTDSSGDLSMTEFLAHRPPHGPGKGGKGKGKGGPPPTE